jgi:hypothetical protein
MRARSITAAAAAFLGVAAVAVALAASAAAGGTHTVTLLQSFHGTQTTTGVNPCTGNAIDLSETTNMVFHLTFFPAGDEAWGTFTEEDKFVGVDEGTGEVYTGHATFWGNFNQNNQNSNSTNIASIHATGSLGDSISYRDVMHFTMLPDGSIVVSFDKPSTSCG